MKDRIRARIRRGLWVLLGVIVIAFFNALMLGVAYYRMGSSVNPLNWVKFLFQRGIPWKLWFLVFLVYGLLAGILFSSAIWEPKDMDLLHRNFKMAKGRQTYGEAHFEQPKEYRKVAIIQHREDAYGSIFGQLDDSGQYLVVQNLRDRTIPNLNKAVFGSAGVGKSYSYVKPECLQVIKRRESVVITDPDGGLYRDMAAAFEKNGYIVRCLNLKDLQHSDGWNCMRALSKETLSTDSAIFARTIINNSSVDTEGIYRDGPESLLNALILRVFLGREYQGDQVNIRNAYNILLSGNGEEYLDTIFDMNQLTEEERPCRLPYLVFKKASVNLRGNLIVNLASSLNILQDDNLSRVLSTDDIDLELPGKRPCAYFCIFPDSHDTYKFIVSLFFSMLFIKLIALADVQPDGRLPVPVNFLLDEFANIGVLPDWDQKMATIRKRAIHVTMILQNITQLQNSYDKAWWTILSNCATWLFLGVNDEETAKILSSRIGQTTAEVRTDQHRAGESLLSFQWGHNTGEGRRDLLAPDELNKMERAYNVIIFQGHNPILARKFPVTQHPLYDQLEVRPPSSLPGVKDHEAREKRFLQEAERLAAYEKNHPESEVDRTFETCCKEARLPTFWNRVVDGWKLCLEVLREDMTSPKEGPQFEELVFTREGKNTEPERKIETLIFERESPEEKAVEMPAEPDQTPLVEPVKERSEPERIVPEPAKPQPMRKRKKAERQGEQLTIQEPVAPDPKQEEVAQVIVDKRLRQKYAYSPTMFMNQVRPEDLDGKKYPGKRKKS